MRTQHVYTKRRPTDQTLNQQRTTKRDRCEAGGALVSSRFRLLGSSNLGGGNTDAIDVAEEQNAFALALGAIGGLNPLAGAGRGPHGLEEASPASVGLGAVVLAHDGLNGLAGLVGVVEGDVADIVVQHVGLDDAVEDVTTNEAEVTVDGGSSAAGEVPHLGLVVGEGGVGVLQEGNGHCEKYTLVRLTHLKTRLELTACRSDSRLTEPVVDPEVRDAVPHKKVQPSIGGTDIVQKRAGEQKAEVTQDNQLGILGLVQGARGVKVVDTTTPAVLLALAATLGLLLVVIVASDVGDQVQQPAKQLLADHVGGSRNGSLLNELAELVDGLADASSVLVAGLGNEDHVTGNVSGSLVVLAVGDLPREVGDQQEGVADPADSVVQDLGGGEGLVTALVGQDPNTGTDEALDNGVQGPQGHASRHEGNSLRGDIVVEEVEDGGQDSHVAEDIVQTGDGGAVEAVSRNGIANLLDGEIGDLELVAIRVKHLGPVLVLVRGHGGQRGRRGRLARAVEG